MNDKLIRQLQEATFELTPRHQHNVEMQILRRIHKLNAETHYQKWHTILAKVIQKFPEPLELVTASPQRGVIVFKTTSNEFLTLQAETDKVAGSIEVFKKGGRHLGLWLGSFEFNDLGTWGLFLKNALHQFRNNKVQETNIFTPADDEDIPRREEMAMQALANMEIGPELLQALESQSWAYYATTKISPDEDEIMQDMVEQLVSLKGIPWKEAEQIVYNYLFVIQDY